MKKLTSFLLFLLVFTGFSVQAQKNSRIEQIKTFPVNAEVVGLLQGTNDMAVLRITKVDSNKYRLHKNDEILVKFFYTTENVKNEEKLEGIEKGDKIGARLHAEKNEISGQWEYTAFHYVVVPPTKSSSTDTSAQPQK